MFFVNRRVNPNLSLSFTLRGHYACLNRLMWGRGGIEDTETNLKLTQVTLVTNLTTNAPPFMILRCQSRLLIWSYVLTGCVTQDKGHNLSNVRRSDWSSGKVVAPKSRSCALGDAEVRKTLKLTAVCMSSNDVDAVAAFEPSKGTFT